METPLLQTKLYIPPLRPELVPRSRLIERLNAGIHRKLALISAPAGFGKTTLVSEWLAGCSRSAAWLSLDENDSDPTRFLVYLVAALQTIDTEIGKGALSALQSPQPPPAETILTALINEIAALSDPIVFVLDDYHLIETQAIHDALGFLLEHLPPGMHLVIATREDPLLPLARLRARGQLTELRATDLRFTHSETAAFLNQAMGLDLSADDIAALESRTEGWVAGLQLAALSMQGSSDAHSFTESFTGSHRYVLDYLIEEVLQQQPESIQRFMLLTSILDQLTGSLCDALSRASHRDTRQEDGSTELRGASCKDTPGGQQTLEALERANLFIVPLDNERRWYRYHHLFADLLRQRLQQSLPSALPGGERVEATELHRRASEWYGQEGLVHEAIDHALRGGHFERAAYLIEERFGSNYERIDQATLHRWLAETPQELICSTPQLCILQAWGLFTSGQLEAANQSLGTAEKLLDASPGTDPGYTLDQGQPSDTNKANLAGRIATMRSFLASYSGDTPGTIQYARQALEHLSEQELQWRTAALITLGDAYANQGQMDAAHEARSAALAAGKAAGDAQILMMADLRLAEILRQQGKLQQVVDVCERQWESAEKNGLSEMAIVGWLLGIWGEVLAELNQLDRAVAQAKRGAELAERGRDVLYQVMSNLCLTRVLFSNRDVTGAQDVIRSMRNTMHKDAMPSWALHQLSSWQVRVWLAQGELDAASQWLQERELDPGGELSYLHEPEYTAFARVLIAQGRLEKAIQLLRRLLEAAESGERHSRAIEVLNLQALALQALGDSGSAISALDRALTLAKPGGFVRTFVDEGPPMARLLYEALSRGIALDYVRRLLAAFPVTEPEQTDSAKIQTSTSELIEPLSERELEILALIAEGLTNPEIASRLFIALNTVKGHARNIYGKLNVHSRTQAVARAQALGLLQCR